jgi:hypothetical protein
MQKKRGCSPPHFTVNTLQSLQLVCSYDCYFVLWCTVHEAIEDWQSVRRIYFVLTVRFTYSYASIQDKSAESYEIAVEH